MNNSHDLAWCAGFFDGEGSVKYTRARPHRITGNVAAQLQCQIAQKGDNREVLEFFQSTIGFGKIRGPYKYKTPGGREDVKYVLVYNTNEVMRLLILLKPYLKSRKTLDFQVAIMAYHMHDSTATEEDYARVKRLDEKRRMKHGKTSA